MQVNRSVSNHWKSLMQRNDVNTLAELLKMSVATVSRIIHGKQNTSIETVEIINNYFKNRKKQIAKIENDLN